MPKDPGLPTPFAAALEFTLKAELTWPPPSKADGAVLSNAGAGLVRYLAYHGSRLTSFTLLELIRTEVPTWRYPAVCRLERGFLKAFQQRLVSADVLPRFGLLSHRQGCCREAYVSLADVFSSSLESIRLAAETTLRETPGLVLAALEVPMADNIRAVLKRLAAHCGGLQRPRLVSSLAPTRPAYRETALSKLDVPARRAALDLMILRATSGLRDFLHAVREAEVMTDGVYPVACNEIATSNSNIGWSDVTTAKALVRLLLLRRLESRRSEPFESVEDEEVSPLPILRPVLMNGSLKDIVDALAGDQALLDHAFRLGIYQDQPGAAFAGLNAHAAPHPAAALRHYVLGAYRAAPGEERLHAAERALVSLLDPTIEVMHEAYMIYRAQRPTGGEGQPLMKRRRVLGPVQEPLPRRLPPSPVKTSTATAAVLFPESINGDARSSPSEGTSAGGGERIIASAGTARTTANKVPLELPRTPPRPRRPSPKVFTTAASRSDIVPSSPKRKGPRALTASLEGLTANPATSEAASTKPAAKAAPRAPRAPPILLPLHATARPLAGSSAPTRRATRAEDGSDYEARRRVTSIPRIAVAAPRERPRVVSLPPSLSQAFRSFPPVPAPGPTSVPSNNDGVPTETTTLP
ncbi:hypothetical protein C8R46DRAFT_1308354 [Mycena filopes]|nr:hypothetical protein C8R46DRAFT_1308354 [Mycena filopes]